jgi:hypothetical protein
VEPLLPEPVPLPELTPPEPVLPDPVPPAPVPVASLLPEPVPQEPLPGPAPPERPVFDYLVISEEALNAATIDIRELIGSLNRIIRRGDFNAWIDCLDRSYLERLSSREYLDAVSQSPRLKSRGEPLKDLEDYFFNVVIPSRANTSDRVDDIDIELVPEEEKVLAFRTTANGQRQRLYELKNIDGAWKIVN